jgi:hypothetical protein
VRISPRESNSLILLLETVNPLTWHAAWITTSKPKRAAQLAQFGNAAFGAVAEAEVGSLHGPPPPAAHHERCSDEFRGAHAGELRGEGKHQDCVDAGISQQLQPRLQRRNQLGAAFRTQETQRVWIECNRYRPRRSCRGACLSRSRMN